MVVESNKGPVNPTARASKNIKKNIWGCWSRNVKRRATKVADENKRLKDLEEFVENNSTEFPNADNPDYISNPVAFVTGFSVADGTINTPTTVEQTVSRLSEIGIDATNSDRVSVTATVAEAGLTNLPGINESTQGVVIGDKAYLFTDNIQVGNEVGIFLHEVGTHIGLVNLVGRANYNF